MSGSPSHRSVRVRIAWRLRADAGEGMNRKVLREKRGYLFEVLHTVKLKTGMMT